MDQAEALLCHEGDVLAANITYRFTQPPLVVLVATAKQFSEIGVVECIVDNAVTFAVQSLHTEKLCSSKFICLCKFICLFYSLVCLLLHKLIHLFICTFNL